MKSFPCLLRAIFVFGLAIPAVSASEAASTVPVPPLDSKEDVYMSECVTDPLIYGSAVGRKRVVMVYLDFADGVMDVDIRERATKVLGGATFEELFAIPVDDPASPSKVFVLEVAQARWLKDGERLAEDEMDDLTWH